MHHVTLCLQDGKEHYVFFAFPHIAINSAGEVGAITRPGRPNKSCACGALQKALIELKTEGYEDNCKVFVFVCLDSVITHLASSGTLPPSSHLLHHYTLLCTSLSCAQALQLGLA